MFNFLNGVASTQVTEHTGTTTCNNTPTETSIADGTIAYTLGSAVTVDGSVNGITTATQLNNVFTGVAPLDPFDLVAIKDGVLFLGNGDGTNNGTTAALRPTQLKPTESNLQTALTSIDGVWSGCANTGGGSSIQIDLTYTAGTGSSVESTFGSPNCDVSSMISMETETFTYVLGSQVTVGGAAEGNTSATQFTSTNTTVGGANIGDMEFDLVAINGTKLFLGNTDGANDGSSAEKRATELQNITFNKN